MWTSNTSRATIEHVRSTKSAVDHSLLSMAVPAVSMDNPVVTTLVSWTTVAVGEMSLPGVPTVSMWSAVMAPTTTRIPAIRTKSRRRAKTRASSVARRSPLFASTPLSYPATFESSAKGKTIDLIGKVRW